MIARPVHDHIHTRSPAGRESIRTVDHRCGRRRSIGTGSAPSAISFGLVSLLEPMLCRLGMWQQQWRFPRDSTGRPAPSFSVLNFGNTMTETCLQDRTRKKYDGGSKVEKKKRKRGYGGWRTLFEPNRLPPLCPVSYTHLTLPTKA